MTTRLFFTTLMITLLSISAIATGNHDEDPVITRIILLTNGESVSGNSAESALSVKGEQYAQALTELFKTTHVDAVYSCGNDHTSTTVDPLASSKGVAVEHYDASSLSKSLFDMYSSNQGKTIVICADDKNLPKMLNMLTGTRDYSKNSLADGKKIFFVNSERLGSGTVKVVPLNNQI